MKMEASLCQMVSISVFEKWFWTINVFEKFENCIQKKLICHDPDRKETLQNIIINYILEKRKSTNIPACKKVRGSPPVSSI